MGKIKVNGEEVNFNNKKLDLLLDEELLRNIKKDLKKPINLIKLCDKYNMPPKDIKYILHHLSFNKYNIKFTDNSDVYIDNYVEYGGKHRINLEKFENKTYKIGFVSDDHLCNKAERLDVLNALFDIYEKEGITQVFNGGNWIDGEARFNKLDIHTFGMSNQINYFIKNYPQRKNITINFIAGDDHEGWYQQREGVIIGEYLQMKARASGRNDLNYLGYMESDIELKAKNGSAILRVVHAGGGTAYALSYSVQKMIESLQGGDKPHILLIGHYHKAEVLPSYRNVRAVQGGCTSDQTRFMRKNKIEAHVGGWIIEFQQSSDGAINRFKTEFISFFDKEYYKQKKYYI